MDVFLDETLRVFEILRVSESILRTRSNAYLYLGCILNRLIFLLLFPG
jgi:hypothetical protein